MRTLRRETSPRPAASTRFSRSAKRLSLWNRSRDWPARKRPHGSLTQRQLYGCKTASPDVGSTAFQLERSTILIFQGSFKPLLPVLAIGGVIAAVTRFDLAFEAITFGSSVLRVFVFAALAIAGAFFAGRVGLRLQFHGTKHPILVGIGAAAIVATAVALIDGFVFRSDLSASYVEIFETVSLRDRLEYFMLRAFNENVFYRLFLFSVFAWAFGAIWRRAAGGTPPAAIWLAMVAAQVTNIAINVVAPSIDPVTLSSLTYDAVRYIAPGVAWAYLFTRFGFATAEIASVGCHVFLQPALGAAL